MGLSIGLATLLSGIVAAGSSAASTISAGKLNKRGERYGEEQNKLNRDFQAQQAQLGRDFQEEMYNKYYSPSAQMAQFRDAGINPAQAFSQITGNASVSAPSASGGSSVSSPMYQNPFSNTLGLVHTIMDLAQLDADVNLKNSQAKLMESQATGQDISNRYSAQMFEQDLKQGKLNLQNTIAGINLALSNIRLNNDELLNNVVARARDISALRKMDSETITEYFKQGLIIAQTITESHRGKQIDLDNFAKQWRNDFIRTKHVNPELAQGMWGLMTQALGTLYDSIVGAGSAISQSIRDWLQDNPYNFLKGKFKSFKPITKLISPFNPL